MITVYPSDCTDFSSNGLGALQPIECTIHEIAGGAYELNMVHPIDSSNRWTQVTNGCFIKAPAPVRESPMYESDADGSTEETVTRKIYRVATNGLKLRLREAPSTSAKVINSYKPGTEVARLDVDGNWYKVSVCDGGAVGYMYGGNLTYVRDVQETITNNKPVTREGVKVQPARDQIFRVVSVETDSETGLVTVKALHVFYDLRGNLVNAKYEPEGIATNSVVSHIASHLLNPSGIHLHCTNTEPISGDFSYKPAVEALLDPDEGILTKSDSILVRDNFDAYIIPNQTRDMGVTIRRGKNLIGATVNYDSTDIITRIIPVGKDKDGNDLFLDGTIYVDSPHINDYPTIYSVKKDYNVRVVKSDPDNVTTFTNIDDARAELRDLALDEFDAGADVPSYSIDVDFVLLSQAQGYEDYADLQSIHIYDTVTVIDSMIGLNTKIKMTEYEWDCLGMMYNSVKLCDAQSVEQTVYSYNLPTGGVSGSKIATGSMSGNAIRSASIDYAKITNAAIGQLTTDSVNAVKATIRDLVAHQITTDQLYVDLATIAIAQITTANIQSANIQWANIQSLVAEIASVATAEIGSAKIGYAQIYDLAADTALIRAGSANNFFFDKLAVTSAQMVDLTVGQLTVKAADNNYYALNVDISTGNVTAQQVTVTAAEIAAGKTSTGNHIIETDLTVGELSTTTAKATEALINKLTAQRIDVAELFALQATINALDSYIIQASTIQALEGQLNVWANDKITLAVEDVKVGGANLLRGTNSISAIGADEAHGQWSDANWRNAGGGTGTRTVVDVTNAPNGSIHKGVTLTMSSTGTVLSNGVDIGQNGVPITAGETYTISCYVKGSGRVCMAVGISAYKGDHFTLANTGAWERFTYTFVMPSDSTYISNSKTNAFFGATAQNSNFTVCGMQLQVGNKATDWSPSAEDMSTQVGGTNLLKNSGTEVSNGTYNIAKYDLTESIPAGEQVTLRLWGTLASGKTGFAAYNSGGYVGLADPLLDNGDGTFSKTFNWRIVSGGNTASNTQLYIYVKPSSASGTSTITKIKLERGNKATDWSPAPADADAEYASIRSEIQQTANEISLAVEGVKVGGTNLLPDTKKLTIGSTGDYWMNSADSSTYTSTDVRVQGFTLAKIVYTSGTAQWHAFSSPYVPLTMDWYGKQITFSSYIYSADWSAVNSGCSVSLALEDTVSISRKRWGDKTVVNADGTWGTGVVADTSAPVNNKWIRFSVTFTLNETGIPNINTNSPGTFTDMKYMKIIYWLVQNGDIRFYAPKLEWGNKATSWCDSEGELVNSSMTLNDKGIFLSTTGTFQLDAQNPDQNAYLNIRNLLQLDNAGGLSAKRGTFEESLVVAGGNALTTNRIKVQSTQPSGHDIIWLQPTTASRNSYSCYSSSVRDNTVRFGYQNPLQFSFSPSSASALANANFTYTLEFDVISLSATPITGLTFKATAAHNNVTVTNTEFSTQSVSSMTEWQVVHITLTASTTKNLCTSATDNITVNILAGATNTGMLASLYVQSQQYMTLAVASDASSGAQACVVKYIP